ncbi:hypothetical protein [Planomicrobium okeanokoites]|nr:hypothetical protein [Planomicrobium okeanokoites]
MKKLIILFSVLLAVLVIETSDVQRNAINGEPGIPETIIKV